VSASRARRVREEPLVNAENMEMVVAVWEEPYRVSIRELSQADDTGRR